MHGEAADLNEAADDYARTIKARFGPCEIKTFRVPADPAQPVTETNLIELEDAEL